MDGEAVDCVTTNLGLSSPIGQSMSFSARFYPDFIQILSRFYSDFIQVLSRFYPGFIHIFFRFYPKNLDKIRIKPK